MSCNVTEEKLYLSDHHYPNLIYENSRMSGLLVGDLLCERKEIDQAEAGQKQLSEPRADRDVLQIRQAQHQIHQFEQQQELGELTPALQVSPHQSALNATIEKLYSSLERRFQPTAPPLQEILNYEKQNLQNLEELANEIKKIITILDSSWFKSTKIDRLQQTQLIILMNNIFAKIHPFPVQILYKEEDLFSEEETKMNYPYIRFILDKVIPEYMRIVNEKLCDMTKNTICHRSYLTSDKIKTSDDCEFVSISEFYSRLECIRKKSTLLELKEKIDRAISQVESFWLWDKPFSLKQKRDLCESINTHTIPKNLEGFNPEYPYKGMVYSEKDMNLTTLKVLSVKIIPEMFFDGCAHFFAKALEKENMRIQLPRKIRHSINETAYIMACEKAFRGIDLYDLHKDLLNRMKNILGKSYIEGEIGRLESLVTDGYNFWSAVENHRNTIKKESSEKLEAKNTQIIDLDNTEISIEREKEVLRTTMREIVSLQKIQETQIEMAKLDARIFEIKAQRDNIQKEINQLKQEQAEIEGRLGYEYLIDLNARRRELASLIGQNDIKDFALPDQPRVCKSNCVTM